MKWQRQKEGGRGQGQELRVSGVVHGVDNVGEAVRDDGGRGGRMAVERVGRYPAAAGRPFLLGRAPPRGGRPGAVAPRRGRHNARARYGHSGEGP